MANLDFEKVLNLSCISYEFMVQFALKLTEYVNKGKVDKNSFNVFPKDRWEDFDSMSEQEIITEARKHDIIVLTFPNPDDYDCNWYEDDWYNENMKDVLYGKELYYIRYEDYEWYKMYKVAYKIKGKWEVHDNILFLDEFKLQEIRDADGRQIIFFRNDNLTHMAYVEQYLRDYNGESDHYF